jgi:hypothetical protein
MKFADRLAVIVPHSQQDVNGTMRRKSGFRHDVVGKCVFAAGDCPKKHGVYSWSSWET